jgi:predicted metalloendopeptidase
VANAAAAADKVMAFETAVAKANWPITDRRDISKINNPMSLREAQQLRAGRRLECHVRGRGSFRPRTA